MPDDDFDAKLGEMIGEEIDKSSEASGASEETDSDSTERIGSASTEAPDTSSTEPTASDSSGRTRDRTQYPMYLPEEQAEALNQLYERFNAERVLEGEPKAEKNKHFNEAVAELVLENQDELLERVAEQIDEP